MFRCLNCGDALPALTHPVATLGTFDGVHLGHQRVIRETVEWAKQIEGQSVVVTFDRHPRRVIRGEATALITSVEHRLVLLERLGVDVAAVLRFDTHMAELSPEDFAQRVFFDWLHVESILLGFDCAFGKDRRGDLALLERVAPRGVQVRSCPPVEVDGAPVSSTAVREAIERGDLEAAARMLGRRPSLMGTVERGSGLGRELGFPTANLDLHHEAKPPDGVYLTYAVVGQETLPSLTNIGTRPTIHRESNAPSVVEVYIDGIDRPIYGQDVEVQFVRKLREEVAFGSREGLARQMAEDREAMLAELRPHSASAP